MTLSSSDPVTRAQFDALKARVDALSAAPPGLLEAGTTLTKGGAYFRFGAAWQLLTPASHERAEGVVGVVDRNGNLIADGNSVDVTGLGFTNGASYYVENANAQGGNLAATPSPLTAALMPTATRSFLSVGTVVNVAGRTLLVFRMQANINPAAKFNAIRTTVFADVAYNATPTLTQVNRLIDTTAGDLSKNKLIADGDVDASPGFLETSPISRVIGGVTKTVFLQDVGFGGLHARIPEGWENLGAGDFLLTMANQDNDNVGGGPCWGTSAGLINRVVFYGGGGLVDYYLMLTSTVSGATVTDTALTQLNFDSAGVNKLRYFHVRMNISADRKTITFKTWGRNTAKPQERQAEDEPAAPQITYVSPTPFPIGGVGWAFSNGYVRRVMASYSADPAIKAAFVSV